MTRQVQPEANRIIGEKVYEYEQDFRARKTELADELRTYPAWQRVYTQIQRKAAAAVVPEGKGRLLQVEHRLG